MLNEINRIFYSQFRETKTYMSIVSLYGPDKSLLDSGYFNYYVKLEDLIGNR